MSRCRSRGSVGLNCVGLPVSVFAGTVKNGFILHPDDTHVLYPLGTTVVIKHLKNGTQRFLQKGGHDRDVSCMALSPTGKYLASGQIAQSAFQVRGQRVVCRIG